MREIYNIEAWWMLTPWWLLVVTILALAHFWHLSRELNKSNGKAQQELWDLRGKYNERGERLDELCFKNDQLEAGIRRANEIRAKAEASAREADAGNRESARLLQVAEAELAKYRPNRDKKGHFIPKKKAEKPSAKSTKGH